MINQGKRLIASMLMSFSFISTCACLGFCWNQGNKIQSIDNDIVSNQALLYEQSYYDVDFDSQKQKITNQLKQKLDNGKISKYKYEKKLQELETRAKLIDEMIKENCSSVTKHQQEVREITHLKQYQQEEQKKGFVALAGAIISTGTFAAGLNLLHKKENEEEDEEKQVKAR